MGKKTNAGQHYQAWAVFDHEHLRALQCCPVPMTPRGMLIVQNDALTLTQRCCARSEQRQAVRQMARPQLRHPTMRLFVFRCVVLFVSRCECMILALFYLFTARIWNASNFSCHAACLHIFAGNMGTFSSRRNMQSGRASPTPSPGASRQPSPRRER